MRYPAILLIMLVLQNCVPDTTTIVPDLSGEVPISFAPAPEGPVLLTAHIKVRTMVGQEEVLHAKGIGFSATYPSYQIPDQGSILGATYLGGEALVLYSTEGDSWHLVGTSSLLSWDLGRHTAFSLPEMQAWAKEGEGVVTFSEYATRRDMRVPIFTLDFARNVAERSEALVAHCLPGGCYTIAQEKEGFSLNSVTTTTSTLTVTGYIPGGLVLGGQAFSCASAKDPNRFVAVSGNAYFDAHVTDRTLAVSLADEQLLAQLTGNNRIEWSFRQIVCKFDQAATFSSPVVTCTPSL